MKYLIVQDWNSTSGNHAGMKHMCGLLATQYPCEYEIYVKGIPRSWPLCRGKNLLCKIKNKLISLKRNRYIRYIYPKEYLELCQPLFAKLKEGDEVFLLEYLIPWASQYELACYIRKNFPTVRLYALSHLTGKYFDEMTAKDPDIIQKWAQPVDKMLTLGSSLSSYFEKAGVPKEKISTGFHYVDSDYYHKQTELCVHQPIRIITMGALQRDYQMLAEVVKKCPDVHWIVCRGRKKVDNMFPNTPNVELKGFMEEEELRRQMDRADISLNVMEDTVGSNVITTSMAMGLAMIVTDVGSIRDYCGEDNTIFCQNEVENIVKNINRLKDNPQKVIQMKEISLRRSQTLIIKEVNNWFNSL
ncbi:MAG: glycosyltransferase [Bacteroidaceae bacterium]|nr:glycosyltransferase [Bacteroidaceae bacterium]